MTSHMRPEKKTERLNLRISASEKDKLERASQAANATTSQFVIEEAVAAAEQVLAEQNRFVLPPDAWDELTARLDAPARTLPALEKLAAERSPFDD